MYPPLNAAIWNDPGVRAVLGSEPRVFPFGEAPQGVKSPYALWQVVNGLPENYLADVPDIDSWQVQVDVYAVEQTDARKGARALRDALEKVAYIQSWRGEGQDPDTREYRYSFDVSFLTPR